MRENGLNRTIFESFLNVCKSGLLFYPIETSTPPNPPQGGLSDAASEFSMKILTIVFVLSIASQVCAQIQITKPDLDSLKFAYSLDEVIGYLQSKVPDVRDSTLFKQKSLQIIQAYYNFQDGKAELEILAKETDNLQAIYQLYLRKQKTSQASDLEVLQAHNNYLNRKFAVISKQSEARNSLIELAKLLNLNIKINNETQTKNSQDFNRQ